MCTTSLSHHAVHRASTTRPPLRLGLGLGLGLALTLTLTLTLLRTTPQASFARGGLLLADYINAMSTAMCAVKVRGGPDAGDTLQPESSILQPYAPILQPYAPILQP